MREPLHQSIVDGAGEVGRPDLPVDAVHLHRVRPGVPAAGHGEVSVLAAVAVGDRVAAGEPRAVLHHGAGAVQLPDAPARCTAFAAEDRARARTGAQPRPPRIRWSGFSAGFERDFETFRESYRNALSWALSQAAPDGDGIRRLMVVSVLLFPLLGRDFFPQVDAGQMRLHVRAPAGHAAREDAAVLRRGRGGRSASWSATDKST